MDWRQAAYAERRQRHTEEFLPGEQSEPPTEKRHGGDTITNKRQFRFDL